MKRRESRQLALELIFEGDFHGFAQPETIYQTAREIRGFEDDTYVRTLFFGVAEKYEELDQRIAENAKGWKPERLSRLVLAVLRLCTYEMLFCENIPYNIAINEAMELIKQYDYGKSPAFVNGVLNAIAESGGLKG